MKIKNINTISISEIDKSQKCDVGREKFVIKPFTMVIFGGAGDLSQRKLIPAVYHLFRDNEIKSNFSILGFSRSKLSDLQYRALVKSGLKKFNKNIYNEKSWTRFARNLYFQSGDFEDKDKYRELCGRIDEISIQKKGEKINLIFYMAVPPDYMPVIIDNICKTGITDSKFDVKIIVEKPFGTDRKSAVKLNQHLHKTFNENQIYRIDHYLGKETVQNIIFFRFANSIFEPIWNSRFIDNVQITVAESIGVGHRGRSYERAGVIRDIVQNHIMQLIGLVAMEPPVGFQADYIRDEKVKVIKSIREMSGKDIDKYSVIGQYGAGKINGKSIAGYRQEKDVGPDSITPTFFAARFLIDNRRWAGVPFYIRAGKRMNMQKTQICIQFKQPPLGLFDQTCDVLQSNLLILTLQPQEDICLRFGVKYPKSMNKIFPVYMTFGYEDNFKTPKHPAYERLLIDCMKGDLSLFVRQDGVEAMWNIVDPIISRWEKRKNPDFPNYPAGSWGPGKADVLLKNDDRYWISK